MVKRFVYFNFFGGGGGGGGLCTFSFLVLACSWYVIPFGGGCSFGSGSSLLGWIFWIGSVCATEKLAFGCSHCCGEDVGQLLDSSPFGDRMYAYDTTVYESAQTLVKLMAILNEELERIEK